MNFTRFIPNSREAGAVAILLVALAVIAGGLFFGMEMVGAKQIELEAKTNELDALKRRLQLPVREVNAAANSTDVFLPGANFALAANALQQHVVEAIDQSSGKLLTVGVETPTPEATASRRVVVQSTSELDNDGLQNLLHILETGRPMVLIDSVVVRRPATRREGEDDSKIAPKLTVELRVVGYYRGAVR
jgi:hypothetical protein